MSKPEKILAQELINREVLDLKAGEVVGSIRDFALTRDGLISLIGILAQDWFIGGQGVPPSSVTNVKHERVTVSDTSALTEFAPDGVETFSVRSNDYIRNKSVLSEDGEELGKLQDFAFQLDDGKIVDLVVLDANEKKAKIPVDAIQTIGRDYIVIVRGKPSFERADDPPVAADVTDEAPTKKMTAELPADAPVTKEPAEPSRTEEKEALFGGGSEEPVLNKFDQKKRDFLNGREAHRDISTEDGELIVAKGEPIEGEVLAMIIEHNLLGKIFIEMTLNK